MKRRNFIKKILISFLGLLAIPNKMISKQVFQKSNFKDGIFLNNYLPHDEKSSKDFWKWRKERKEIKIEPISFPLAKNDLNFLQSNRTEKTLTFIGHASFLIQINGLNILTDPHFTKRASPLSFAGPLRTTPPGIRIEDLPEIDVILISHNHYDHLDKGSIKGILKSQKNQPAIFTPLKLDKLLEKWGAKNVKGLNWWESTIFKNLKFHSVPVQHWSKRSLSDTNKTLWCGWVIEKENFRIFFCGDTGYSKDFADIQNKFKVMDLSLLPIGAYEPRWFMKDHHCNVEEAIQIHHDLNSKRSIGMHWGTFILTDEPMREPLEKLKKLTKEKNMKTEEFIAIQHGATIKI